LPVAADWDLEIAVVLPFRVRRPGRSPRIDGEARARVGDDVVVSAIATVEFSVAVM